MKVLLAVTFVAYSAATVAAAGNACTISDFEPKYGPCSSSGTRTRSYIKKPESQCVVGAHTLSSLETTAEPCVCTLDELVPVSASPVCDVDTNEQIVTGYKKKIGATCTTPTSFDTLPKGTAMCTCSTEHHMAHTYGKCNANGLQESFSYWKSPCKPTDGDGTRSMAERSALIPCGLSCEPGEYMTAPLTNCTKCPAGTISHKGESFLPPYKQLPPHFVTYCYEHHATNRLRIVTAPCANWKPSQDGSYMSAGPYPNLSMLQSQIGYTAAVVEHPATVSFDYWMDTEKDGDYFVVFANSHVLFYDSGNSQGWKSYSASIPEDTHQCAWSVGEGSEHCLHTNQLSPYIPTTFFHYDGSGDFTIQVPVAFTQDNHLHLMNTECQVLSPQLDAKNKILIAPVNEDTPGGCTTRDMINHAIRSEARGLFIYNKTGHITGPSSWVTRSLQIGLISVEAAMALKASILNNKTNPKAEVAVTHNTKPGRAMEFKFMYSKDRWSDVGADEVRIRNFRVQGLKKHATECTKCPVGTGSLEGSSECKRCPVNTKAPTAGTAYPCIPCPPRQVSPAGAAECMPSQDCTIADYIPVHSKCYPLAGQPGQYRRKLSYIFSGTKFCDPANSDFQVPAPTEVACGACNAGSYFSNKSHACVQCPDGEVPWHATVTNPGGETEGCTQCTGGFAPRRVLSYASFDVMNGTFPPLKTSIVGGEKTITGWSRDCDACIGDGWTFGVRESAEVGAVFDGSATIHVGRAVMVGGTATLTLFVDMETKGSVSFGSYGPTTNLVPNVPKGPFGHGSQDKPHQDMEVSFTAQDAESNFTYASKTFTRFFGPSVSTYSTPLLPAGAKRLTWTYKNTRDLSKPGKTSEYGIASLDVFGVDVGPAGQCVPCQAGYYCLQGVDPMPCPPGSYSRAGLSSCIPCAGSESAMPVSISETYANAQCERCPLGHFANDAATACVVPGCQWAPDYWIAASHGHGKHYNAKTHKGSLTGIPIRSVNTPRHITAYEYDLTHFNKLHHTTINGNSDQGTQGDTHLPIYFRLCDVLTSKDKLTGITGETCGLSTTRRHPNPLPTYACVGTSGDSSIVLGASINITMLMDPIRALEPIGLRVDIDGSGARKSDPEVGICKANPKKRYATTILLYCDPSVESHEYVVGTHTGNCAYNVTLKSQHACPVCTNRSFVRVDSDCDETGYKTRTYSFGDAYGRVLSSRNCVGGDVLPGMKRVKCPYTVVLSEGYNSAWAAITVVLGLVILLLIFAVYQWMQHRKMYDKYNRLENTSGNNNARNEMETVDYEDNNEPNFNREGANGGAGEEGRSESTAVTANPTPAEVDPHKAADKYKVTEEETSATEGEAEHSTSNGDEKKD